MRLLLRNPVLLLLPRSLSAHSCYTMKVARAFCTGAASLKSQNMVSVTSSFQLLGPSEIYVHNWRPSIKTSSTSGEPFIDLMVANFNTTELPSLPPPPPPPHKGLTENLSPTFLSSGNPCLDFFFHVVPNTPPETLTRRLELAWKHDALTTLKLILNLRGVRGTGKSDREGFYTCALWLHKNHPKTLAYNVKWIPQFGYFKDLPEILYRLLEGSDRSKLKPLRMSPNANETRWIEFAKDPSTGCVCYYNETIGGSRWVSPSIAATLPECPSSFPLPPDWVETATQHFGQKIYSNTKTGESSHYYCLGCKEWWFEFAETGGYCSDCSRKEGKKLGVPRETRIAVEMKKMQFQKNKARDLRKEKEMKEARKAVERYSNDSDFRFLYDQISDVFADHLASDLKLMKSGDQWNISLAAKWCPSLYSSYDKTTLLCESIAKRLFPLDLFQEYKGIEEAHYAYRVRDRLKKEILVPLHQIKQLPEIFMSSNRWNLLPYNRVPSVAMKNYQELFLKHDKERFIEYLSNVKVGKAKIAAGALFPHEIVKRLNKGGENNCLVAELQWNRMVEDMSAKGKLKNCIAVCDVSGSMYGTPMDVSVSLGLLLSELSEDPWKGHVITFSKDPQLHKIQGDNLQSKTRFIRKMAWGCNTDFQIVFDKILQVAIDGNLSDEQMIKRVFVFSDMEFDEASGSSRPLYWSYYNDDTEWKSSNTDYEEIQRKFKESGYTVPEIVFWNLRDSKATPVPSDQKGVALVSGFSKNMMTIFLEEEELITCPEKDDQCLEKNNEQSPERGRINPEAAMKLAISGPNYELLEVVD